MQQPLLKGHLQEEQQPLHRNILQHLARATTIVQEHLQEELPSLRIIGEPVRALYGTTNRMNFFGS